MWDMARAHLKPREVHVSIGRRQALGILGAGAWSAFGAPLATPPLRFTMLDHLEFFVSDVQRSAAFYARVFGNTVLKNNRTTRRYVKLGVAYLAIDAGQTIAVDHICADIPDFKIADAHQYLTDRGIAYRDYPSGRDLSIADPDGGVRLQLASDNGWNLLLGGTAAPETVAVGGAPIFQPSGIDHILLNVPDPGKSAAFYEKVLGPVTRRNNNRTWFQTGTSRIGLLKTPEGQRAGVNHFCVSASAFD